MASKKSMKSALESMLFVWGQPLDVKAAADVLNADRQEVYDCFRELQGRGIVIREVNQSFQFVTREENADYIERLCTPVKVRKLSQSALEVLAIVAYKQPVTKGEIEAIRGIKCDRVMDGLIRKDLVCEKGRSDSVGRPILYGTTDTFLENFGFSSLKELPPIDDLEGVIAEDTDVDAEVEKDSDGNPIMEGQMKIEI